MPPTDGEQDISDNWGFREQLIAHTPALRHYAYHLAGRTDGDDAVQTTLLLALQNQDKFTPGTNFRAWLFTILRNSYFTTFRRQRRDARADGGASADLLISPPTQEWEGKYRDLMSALNKLPFDMREVLILSAIDDFSCEEIARLCQCPVGTIKSRIHRGRARLAQILEQERADPKAGSSGKPTRRPIVSPLN